MIAADHADVGHQFDTAVRDHHQVAGELQGLGGIDDRLVCAGFERHASTVRRRPSGDPTG
jgi:hypothetical protein